MTNPLRPRAGRRLLLVAITWAPVTLALQAGSIPLALVTLFFFGTLSVYTVWRWAQPPGNLERSLSSAAVLLAGALISATLWKLGAVVTPEAWIISAGALLHYWLLAWFGL